MFMSEVEESAKAVTETAKLGTTLVEATEKVGGFIAKVLDEPITEAVGMFGDKLKFMRWKNKLKIVDNVNVTLEERGIKNIRPIPPKIAIPLLEQATLEEEEELQDLWCNLIANSLDPNYKLEIRYAFIEVIKNITPLDAKVLKYIYNTALETNRRNQTNKFVGYPVDFFQIKENVHASNVETELSLNNLQRVRCVRDNDVSDLRAQLNEVIKRKKPQIIQHSSYIITPFGTAFILACNK